MIQSGRPRCRARPHHESTAECARQVAPWTTPGSIPGTAEPQLGQRRRLPHRGW